MAEVLPDEDVKDQVAEETMLLAKKDLMQVMKVLARMEMIILPFCIVIFVRHGHIENFCREKAKHPANFVEEKYEESNLFFTCSNKQKSRCFLAITIKFKLKAEVRLLVQTILFLSWEYL